MRRFAYTSIGCVFLYFATFAVVHYAPGMRRPAMDGDWYYSDIESLEPVEFYVFWPLRLVSYGITRTQSRHVSERLPLGLPDGLPTME
jgi:hypothetical protein